MAKKPCTLYDDKVDQVSVSNAYVFCECTYNGLATMAMFIGDALHLQTPGSINAVTAISVCRQVAGTLQHRAHRDGAGWEARFNGVTDMTFSASRNALFICDSGNHCVRMVTLVSPFQVSTVSGCGRIRGYIDGNIRLAQFDRPYGIAVADNGHDIYVTDYGNNVVRKIDTLQGTVESIFGKTASTLFVGDSSDKLHATLYNPTFVKISKSNRFLFIVNSGANSVCRLQIQPSAKTNTSRWVYVLACDKSEFVLKTSIQIAPTGDCVVWRLRSALDDTGASTLSVYNGKNGDMTFQKNMCSAPTQFALRVSLSTMWLTPGMMGTTLHALQSDHMGVSSLIRTSFQLHWQAVRLLCIGGGIFQ